MPLTKWRRESPSVLLTPADRVYEGGCDVTPVIIAVLPAVEVDQHFLSQRVRHRGNTDQVDVFLVHCLQFHAHSKCCRGHHLEPRTEASDRGTGEQTRASYRGATGATGALNRGSNGHEMEEQRNRH